MSLEPTARATSAKRFPRVSGDEPVRNEFERELTGFSPRERG